MDNQEDSYLESVADDIKDILEMEGKRDSADPAKYHSLVRDIPMLSPGELIDYTLMISKDHKKTEEELELLNERLERIQRGLRAVGEFATDQRDEIGQLEEELKGLVFREDFRAKVLRAIREEVPMSDEAYAVLESAVERAYEASKSK